jgi:hypothetical protein
MRFRRSEDAAACGVATPQAARRSQVSELETSSNPIAQVVQAHLQVSVDVFVTVPFLLQCPSFRGRASTLDRGNRHGDFRATSIFRFHADLSLVAMDHDFIADGQP